MQIYSGFFDEIVDDVYNRYDNEVEIRGLKVRERLNAKYVVDPRKVIYNNKARSTPREYLAGEMLWYLTGDDKVDFIKHFSKFWEKIKNDDDTVNSAYGNLIFNSHGSMPSFLWAHQSLIKDKYTRQAIIHFNTPSFNNPTTKDYPCTIYGCFHIRPHNNVDVLTLSIYMRSQDVFKGASFDVPFFSYLLQEMYLNLKTTYTNLTLGNLTMNIDSLHIYESDYKTAEKFLQESTSYEAFELEKPLLFIYGGDKVVCCERSLVLFKECAYDVFNKNFSSLGLLETSKIKYASDKFVTKHIIEPVMDKINTVLSSAV